MRASTQQWPVAIALDVLGDAALQLAPERVEAPPGGAGAAASRRRRCAPDSDAPEAKRRRLAACRVFLGYRVAADADLVEQLHDKLQARGLDVRWDRRCLPTGLPWEQSFADALSGSAVFVPVVSRAALAAFV